MERRVWRVLCQGQGGMYPVLKILSIISGALNGPSVFELSKLNWIIEVGLNYRSLFEFELLNRGRIIEARLDHHQNTFNYQWCFELQKFFQ